MIAKKIPSFRPTKWSRTMLYFRSLCVEVEADEKAARAAHRHHSYSNEIAEILARFPTFITFFEQRWMFDFPAGCNLCT